MRYLGLLLSLVVVALGMSMGGTVGMFLDVPSLVLVIALPLGCCVFSGLRPIRTLGIALRSTPSAEDAGYGARGLRELRSYLMSSGWIGFLVGAIIVGVHVNELDALGPGLSLSLVTVLYAVVGSYVVLKPLQERLERLVEGL